MTTHLLRSYFKYCLPDPPSRVQNVALRLDQIIPNFSWSVLQYFLTLTLILFSFSQVWNPCTGSAIIFFHSLLSLGNASFTWSVICDEWFRGRHCKKVGVNCFIWRHLKKFLHPEKNLCLSTPTDHLTIIYLYCFMHCSGWAQGLYLVWFCPVIHFVWCWMSTEYQRLNTCSYH